jgi:hypothetical protein
MRTATMLVVLLALTGCSARGDAREAYVRDMQTICSAAEQRAAAVPLPVDPTSMKVDPARVRRVNARRAAIAKRAATAFSSVKPPRGLERAHAAFLTALAGLQAAAARLVTATRTETFPAAVERWQAAQKRMDSAAARLGIGACRAP